MNIIELKNINKFFGEKESRQQILKNISINIEKGEMVAIMGPSGSGKSTMLNVLGLLDNNYSGEYMLDGIEASKLSNNELAMARNEKIGFVFQNFNLIKELSAKENVKMSLIFSNIYKKGKEKISKKVMDKSSSDILENVGLKNHENKKPGQLSGGQQQRVAIARALVNNPEIILADEPTGALDSKIGEEIMKVFLKLNNQGKTVIIVTHDERVAQM
ncbi:MAG: ABC transporter ATP-binding protein, partial [Eubacterium sp.]